MGCYHVLQWPNPLHSFTSSQGDLVMRLAHNLMANLSCPSMDWFKGKSTGNHRFPHYPLVNIQKAIENCHLQLIYPLKIVIFHSYVSLPEGNSCPSTLTRYIFLCHGLRRHATAEMTTTQELKPTQYFAMPQKIDHELGQCWCQNEKYIEICVNG